MILRSLRLKNIKSYGEGAEGTGVLIEFAPGINRIAGRNGHGKSTLIESLGYALFLTEPIHEEHFDAATYLVRHGKRAGEIDVTFASDGELYRLERGLGSKNLRRAKVIVVSDGSTAAEGDKEVADFLCRVLRAPDAARLAEWFAKLIGIKQGRLAWPFDSKPSEARKHFEPLLDVEIFRDCFERLKPVADRFTELRREDELRLATVAEQLRERAESAGQLTTANERVAVLTQQAEAAKVQRDGLAVRVEQEAKMETALREAERLHAAARAAHELAVQRHAEAATRAKEARLAVEALAASKVAHEAHVAAEWAEKELHEKQAQCARLNAQRAEQQKALTQFSEKAASAERQAAALRTQATAKAGERDRRQNEWQTQKSESRIDAAQQSEKQAAGKLDEGTKLAAAAREKRSGLAGQLEQIAGGVCPFLKEGCRQFDPAKVQADLAIYEREIAVLEGALDAARKAHEQARKLTLAETQRLTRLDGEEKALAALEGEMARLEKDAAAQDELGKGFSDRAKEIAMQLAESDRAFVAFGELDVEAKRLQEAKAEHATGYRAFLSAKPLAETAPGAEERLRTMTVALERAAGEVVKCATTLEAKRARFDADRLATLRGELAAASEALTMRTSELRHADDALKLARKRHEEWQVAAAGHARLSRELDRRDAALALVEKARRILRDSAPRVAQHLCDRIAARAQRLFNRINHDPSELLWSAERYSLRIEPGDRRFAMLSGGEQTKLALAMTLAMIAEFSTLRFCLFDEPTYGVDADSREVLAEAIVEVQAMSGLEQMLLVSHDDVFDGKIEHVVSVKKSAATGTVVEMAG